VIFSSDIELFKIKLLDQLIGAPDGGFRSAQDVGLLQR